MSTSIMSTLPSSVGDIHSLHSLIQHNNNNMKEETTKFNQLPPLNHVGQVFVRKSEVYIITYPDQCLYWFSLNPFIASSLMKRFSVFSNYYFNMNNQYMGLERAYFVCASACHCLIITDRIDEHGIAKNVCRI